MTKGIGRHINLFGLMLIMVTMMGFGLHAQEVTTEAKLDTQAILIGDWATLTLSATYPEGAELQWPLLVDSIQDLEIVEKSDLDTTAADGRLTISQQLQLTSFDSGYYVIPPIIFRYKQAGAETWDSVETEPGLVMVHTVPVDTTQAFKDIKPPIEVPITFAEVLPYILAGLALIAVIILIVWFIRKQRNKPKEVKEVVEPTRPPHEIALEKLQELEQKKLWQNGEIKQYYIELSDILREYLELKYHFPALESTTDEIIFKLDDMVLRVNIRSKVKEVLQLSDLAKFAKANPLPEEHQKAMDHTYAIVKDTIVAEKKEEEQVS